MSAIEYPISASISGSTSGIPISACTEYRYWVQYRVQYRVIPDIGVDPISGIPISGPATPDIGVNVYRDSTGRRSGGDSLGLHESHDEIILTVTVGFSMRRIAAGDPPIPCLQECLNLCMSSMMSWACPSESTSCPVRTVRSHELVCSKDLKASFEIEHLK